MRIKRDKKVEKIALTPEQWQKEYERREAVLDAMPGGSQGARPDMSEFIDPNDPDGD